MSEDFPPDLADVVAVLADRALAVSAQAGRAPTSVRVACGDVQVEVVWSHLETVSAPAPVPARIAVEPVPPQQNGHATVDPDVFPLCAETVGVFYRAPEPGAPPFVSEGDTVRPGQQVGIVEAMKLMIPVQAGRGGRVVELLVADGAPVEHGEPLMLLSGADR